MVMGGKMNDEQLGERVLSTITDRILLVLDEVFQRHYNDIIGLVPLQYRGFITKGFIKRLVSGSRVVIMKLEPNIKRSIAVDIKKIMSVVEDEYMHSVMVKKPDKSLGLLLEEMGEVKWNGI